MKSFAILRIFKNDKFLAVKQFETDQILFGSGESVQVELQDETVSALHFIIERRNSGYYVSDLGSSSGTKKNGQIILDEPLSSGDSIEAGLFRIQFLIQAVKEKPKLPSLLPEESIQSISSSDLEKPRPPSLPTTPESKQKINPKIETAQKSLSPYRKKKPKGSKTFAPPSEVVDLKSYIKPTKGAIVEVIIAWRERVLHTYHFSNAGVFSIGSKQTSDILIPSSFLVKESPFLEFKGGCRIFASQEMVPEFITEAGSLNIEEMLRLKKAQKTNLGGHTIKIESGDLLCLSISKNLNILVRFVPFVRQPFLTSPLDLSAAEVTTLVVSVMLVGLLALMMSTFAPTEQEPVPTDDQLRMATFIYNKPPVTSPPTTQPMVTSTAVPPPSIPPEKKVQKGSPTKDVKPSPQQKISGKAVEVRAKDNKIERPKKFTSVKQGGAVKLSNTAGGAAKSKDVNKVGLLGAFGNSGIREQIDKSASGTDVLLGMAEKATGKAGQSEDRLGKDLGSKFKDTGAGGKGTATQGIAGIKTQGRSSGDQNYGSGTTLGGKGNVNIEVGGADEGWEGSIDREAVRRVIKSILNQIKNCYERQLRTDTKLEGKVVIEFHIIEQGRVQASKTHSTTLNNPKVEQCVAARIREAHFPEPPLGKSAVVYYPFIFGSQK